MMKIKIVVLFLLTHLVALHAETNWIDIEALIKEANVSAKEKGLSVYLNHTTLIYVLDTTETPVPELLFLHVFPKDINRLSEIEKQYGVGVLDFIPDSVQVMAHAVPDKYKNCTIYIRYLPDYAINSLTTGTYTDGRVSWDIMLPCVTSSFLASLWMQHENYMLYFFIIVFITLGCLIYKNRKKIHSIISLLQLSCCMFVPLSLLGGIPLISYACGILFIIALLGAIKRKKYSSYPILLVFVAMYLVRIIGLIYSPDQHSGWKSLETELSFLLFPCIACLINLTKSDYKLILQGYCLLFLIFIFFCFLSLGISFLAFHLTGYDLKNWAGPLLMWLPYTHPSYYAIMALFTVPIAGYLYFDAGRRKKIALWLILFCVYVGIFILCSGARIAILSYPTVILLCWGYYYRNKNKAERTLMALGVLIILLILGANFNRGLAERFVDPARLQMWKTAAYSIKERPFIGLGTGGVPSQLQSDEYAQKIGYEKALHYGSAHNQFLNEWMQYGLVGGSILFAGIIGLLYISVRKKDFLLLSFLVIEILFFTVETSFETARGVVFFMFWVSSLISTQGVRLPSLNSKE
jgi:O-antigen ligase